MAINTPGTSQTATQPEQFTDILKQVQFDDPQKVALKETGLRIARQIYTQQTGQKDNLNFFSARATRWINILKWATGTQDMSEFLDFFNVSDGNKAYVKIDMSPVMVGPQFMGTLVESMSKNEEYPCVTAIDDYSMAEKESRKMDGLFRMHKVEDIDEMQQASGLQLEPTNAYVPDDELSAEVYYSLEDRLPKEIRFEKLLEYSLIYSQFDSINKRKTIYDLVANNAAVTKIEKDSNGGRCIRKCLPINVFYNYITNDNGRQQLSYIGEFYSLKAREIRAKYGKSEQNQNGLTEKEVFDLVKMSSNRNTGAGFAYIWKEEYQYYNYNRPWDDYSLYVMDFEIAINTYDYYVGKTDSYGNENISEKKGVPNPTSDKARIIKKNKAVWYHGVYCPYADSMLSWGLPELSFYPESLSSYSIIIPNNNGEYVPSLFERALEPLKEYALGKLKRKQLISKLRPSGIRIDVESARNLDLGNGNTIPWEEVIRIYDQTGNELWSSRGVNPLEKETPAISQTASDDTLQKIMQITEVLNSCLAEIRALIGVPMYRDGSDVGDRTAAKLAEAQNTSSFNVTDFINNAYNELLQETLYKICILDWQKAVKEEKESPDDLINTRFKVYVRMRQTAYEQQLLENNIQIAMKTVDGNGKPLLSFKDAFKIRQIKNYKQAELYLANVIEKNERLAQENSKKLQEQNAQVQQASAQQAAQAEKEAQAEKLEAEKDMLEYKTQKEKEVELLKGVLAAAAKDESGQLIRMFLPAIQQLVPNVTIPLAQENKDMQQEAAQQQQQAMMAQMAMQQQNPEEMAEQGAQQNPQEEMMEQQMQ